MGRWSEVALALREYRGDLLRLALDGTVGRPHRAALLHLFHSLRRAASWNPGAVIVSHPKSGRTWLRYMLDRLGIHVDCTHDWLDMRPPPPGYFGGRKILLLIREPRDTAVSGYFHATRRSRQFGGTFGEFLRDRDQGLERIVSFNLYWADRCLRSPGHLILAYEDLLSSPLDQLRRAASFITGRAPAEAELAAAVAAGRFTAMRAVEKSGRGAELYGIALAPVDPSDPESFKTRRGVAEGWRDHFSESDADFAAALFARYSYFEAMTAARSGPQVVVTGGAGAGPGSGDRLPTR